MDRWVQDYIKKIKENLLAHQYMKKSVPWVFLACMCFSGLLAENTQQSDSNTSTLDERILRLGKEMKALSAELDSLLRERAKMPVTTTSRNLFFDLMEEWRTPIGVYAQHALIFHVKDGALWDGEPHDRLKNFVVKENETYTPVLSFQYARILDDPTRLSAAMGNLGVPDSAKINEAVVFSVSSLNRIRIVLADKEVNPTGQP